MKVIFYLIVLAALDYGEKNYYENYLSTSVNNTISRTSDFATDKAVRDFQ